MRCFAAFDFLEWVVMGILRTALGSIIDIITEDGHSLPAYVAGNPNAGKTLILLHEVAGLNRFIRTTADRISAFGYRVIAPNLFDRIQPQVEFGYSPMDLTRGQGIAANVNAEMALADVIATAHAAGNDSIGIVGYGWGGDIAWLAASRTKLFRAGVAWYPPAIANARQDAPNCPFQLHFAEWDVAIPAVHVETIRRAQPQVNLQVYTGATQGFACDERESFNPDIAETARDNMLAFLRRHM